MLIVFIGGGVPVSSHTIDILPFTVLQTTRKQQSHVTNVNMAGCPCTDVEQFWYWYLDDALDDLDDALDDLDDALDDLDDALDDLVPGDSAHCMVY